MPDDYKKDALFWGTQQAPSLLSTLPSVTSVCPVPSPLSPLQTGSLSTDYTEIWGHEGFTYEPLFKMTAKLLSEVNLLNGPTDQPQACTVIPPQQEPGPQAPASDPDHDASQCPAPTHPNPPSGTGARHLGLKADFLVTPHLCVGKKNFCFSLHSLAWRPTLLRSRRNLRRQTRNLLLPRRSCLKWLWAKHLFILPHRKCWCQTVLQRWLIICACLNLPQEAIMAEYLSSKNLSEAVTGVRDMKAPKHFLPEMLSKIVVCSLGRPDEDKEHVSTLIHALRAESLITGENFMQVQSHCSNQTAFRHDQQNGWRRVCALQAFLNVLDQCPKIEQDVPLVKSYLAQFAARAVIAELVSVAELAHPLENGTHFPLFLLCLQQTAKLKDREWLTDIFQQSKVNMQKMLPGTHSALPDVNLSNLFGGLTVLS